MFIFVEVSNQQILTSLFKSFTIGFKIVSIPYFFRCFSLVIANKLIEDNLDLALGGILPSVK